MKAKSKEKTIKNLEYKIKFKKALTFPFTVIKYSFRGLSFIINSITAPDKIGLSDPNRLEGDELALELERVKSQSKDFQNKAATERVKETRKDMNFKYTARDDFGNLVKGKYDAPTPQEAINFLKSQFDELLTIEELGAGEKDISFGGGKISMGALSFTLTQLSTYIKAGIPLIDAMRILTRQTSDATQRKIYQKVVYQLYLGYSFSEALEKQGKAFPHFLVSMIKTSEMTGDLPGTLDEMAEYFTKQELSRKQMQSALIYPAVIFTFAIGAIIFLVMFVVPQFVDMFQSNNAELPAITQFILDASAFLNNNWWILLLVIVLVIVVYKVAFRNLKNFRKTMQTFYMHMPIYGPIIIYNEVSNMTRTFASLLSHGVFITDSMEILSNITSNEIYKEIINRTMIGLSKGAKISETFKGEWAFPIVAYEMLVTGESTGQLAVMMEKVADHFGSLHSNAVDTFKSLLEPIIIAFLAVAVGFIMVSIIMPMFELYGQI